MNFVKFFSIQPFIFLLIFYIPGMLTGFYLNDFNALLFLFFLPPVFFILSFNHKKKISFFTFCIFLSIVLAGFLRVTLFHSEKSTLLSPKDPIFNNKVSILGTLFKPPQLLEKKIHLHITLNSIFYNDRYKEISQKVRITVYDTTLPNIEAGDHLLLKNVKLKLPRNYKNPGMFDFVEHLEKKEIHIIGTVNKANQVTILTTKEKKYSIKKNIFRIKKKLVRFLKNNSPSFASPYLLAMTLGDRSSLKKEHRKKFNNSGLSHLFAISGLHVGFYAAFSFFFINRLLFILGYYLYPIMVLSGNFKRLAALLSFFPVIFYSILVGYRSSTARATIMVLCYLFSIIIKRQESVLNTTALAALILLVLYPQSLFDIGFLLSFTTVLIIILSYKKIISNDKKQQLIVQEYTYITRGKRNIKIFFYITLSACLATYPLIHYQFNQIAVYAAGANFLIIPLCSIIIIVTMISCTLSLISIPVAAIVLKIPVFFLFIALKIIDFFLSFPFSTLYGPSCHLVVLFLYYFLFFGLLLYKGSKKYIIIASQTIFFIFIGFQSVYPNGQAPDGILRVTFIDVGQGESAFIKFPMGKTMLIDGGGTRNNFDKGDLIIVPYLFHEKINKLDYVVSTHPDNDHIGGLFTTVKKLTVSNLILNEKFKNNRSNFALKKIAEHLNINILNPFKIEKTAIDPKVFVEILHPSKKIHPRNLEKQSITLLKNNLSMVIKITYKNVSFLFTADIEKWGEHVILKKIKNIQSTILKVAHHGSKTSSSKNFLSAVSPEIAVISAGYKNRFRHPHKDVLNNLTKQNSQIFRTDIDGAIRVSTDGDKICINTFNSTNLDETGLKNCSM